MTLHLISGLPCSGKTTYASALRTDTNAVLFSLDRWLITAYGKYAIAAVGHEEHTRRVLACRELIWLAASDSLRRCVDVILDDGFFLRVNRAQYIERGKAIGAQVKMHFIDTPLDCVRPRLEARNRRLPFYNFHIDPQTLTAFAALFEVPSPEEGAELIVVRPEQPDVDSIRG